MVRPSGITSHGATSSAFRIRSLISANSAYQPEAAMARIVLSTKKW